MAKKEKIYEYVELTDRTPIQKLSLLDQVRVLFQRLTYDPSLELKREDAFVLGELVLRADLFQFVKQATKPITKGSRKSVEFEIASKFLPVLDSVLRSPKLTDHYVIQINKPHVEYDIPYIIKVRMRSRS